MSVLLRGGRRDVGAPGTPVVAESVGEGVEDDMFEREVTGESFSASDIHSNL